MEREKETPYRSEDPRQIIERLESENQQLREKIRKGWMSGGLFFVGCFVASLLAYFTGSHIDEVSKYISLKKLNEATRYARPYTGEIPETAPSEEWKNEEIIQNDKPYCTNVYERVDGVQRVVASTCKDKLEFKQGPSLGSKARWEKK